MAYRRLVNEDYPIMPLSWRVVGFILTLKDQAFSLNLCNLCVGE
jgi:hypothetical protein